MQAAALAGSVTLCATDPTIAARFGTVLTTDWLAGRTVRDLLYRGSVDGMTAAAFHERCDGKGATLTLIRADEGGRVCVFGGYTSVSWRSPEDGGEWVSCSDAFLFSVTGPHCTVVRFPIKAGKEKEAMYCDSGYGPCFGGDLAVRSRSVKATAPFGGTSRCVCFGDPEYGEYSDTVGLGPATFTGTTDKEGRFTPVDVEVYAVV